MDLGTADEMALDVLINSLITLSREYVGIKQIAMYNENGWERQILGTGKNKGNSSKISTRHLTTCLATCEGCEGNRTRKIQNG